MKGSPEIEQFQNKQWLQRERGKQEMNKMRNEREPKQILQNGW